MHVRGSSFLDSLPLAFAFQRSQQRSEERPAGPPACVSHISNMTFAFDNRVAGMNAPQILQAGGEHNLFVKSTTPALHACCPSIPGGGTIFGGGLLRPPQAARHFLGELLRVLFRICTRINNLICTCTLVSIDLPTPSPPPPLLHTQPPLRRPSFCITCALFNVRACYFLCYR